MRSTASCTESVARENSLSHDDVDASLQEQQISELYKNTTPTNYKTQP